VTIWIFFLLYPGYGHETFKLMKLVGFTLIVIGVMTFNKFISCGDKQEPSSRESIDEAELVSTRLDVTLTTEL
jgi:hypothetical protein